MKILGEMSFRQYYEKGEFGNYRIAVEIGDEVNDVEKILIGSDFSPSEVKYSVQVWSISYDKKERLMFEVPTSSASLPEIREQIRRLAQRVIKKRLMITADAFARQVV